MVKHSLEVPPEGGKPLPRRIILPTDFFPLPNADHQQLLDEFIERLETYLGVKTESVSLAQLWDNNPPSDSLVAGETLQEFLAKVKSPVCSNSSRLDALTSLC